MCGIIGYVGTKSLSKVLLTGLHRLEYRGYDSAGVCTVEGDELQLRRVAGRIDNLEQLIRSEPVHGSIGIAHTRWATHGVPSETNAHPHVDAGGRIALVHNGIIENHDAIRSYLEDQGVPFSTETDTESLVQLIGYLYTQSGNLVESVRQALREVNGTYGIAIVCTDEPDMLIAARRGSPLIVGVGENEYLISSDGNAVVEHTSQVVYVNDNEMVCIAGDGMEVSTIEAEPVETEIDTLEITLEQIQLGTHDHYMLKEIFEQPESLRNCMRGRLDMREGRVVLGGLEAVDRGAGTVPPNPVDRLRHRPGTPRSSASTSSKSWRAFQRKWITPASCATAIPSSRKVLSASPSLSLARRRTPCLPSQSYAPRELRRSGSSTPWDRALRVRRMPASTCTWARRSVLPARRPLSRRSRCWP